MVKNYFTVIIRNLFKHKFHSLLSIISLAIGMATLLIISYYVKYELSYEKFNRNGDNVVRLEENIIKTTEKNLGWTIYPFKMPELVKASCPEVNDYTRIFPLSSAVSYKEKKSLVEDGMHFVDNSFLTMFDCKLLKGDKKNALAEPYTIVLTESVANFYFGKEEPIGKSLKIDASIYRVTGICADAPSNTHLHYKYLLSISSSSWLNSFEGGTVYVYLKLNPGCNLADLDQKLTKSLPEAKRIAEDIKNHKSNVQKFEYKLRPISKIHLYCNSGPQLEKNGSILNVWFLIIVGIFILITTSVININLATSRSIERAKEVGVRKVLGGCKSQLIYQFLAEYLIMNMIAMTIAIIIFIISPLLLKNIILNFNFTLIEILKDGWIWIFMLILLIVIVLISGFYPAFVLSSYKPLSVLRGKLETSSKGVVIRKCLIAFQFVVAIGLIAGAITIKKQWAYMQSKNLGFNINQILIVNGPRLVADSTYNFSASSFKTELLKYNKINSLSFSSEIPGKYPARGDGIKCSDVMRPVGVRTILCDYSFLDVYGMKFLAGRNFSENFGSDKDALIITERTSQRINFKKPDEAVDKQANITVGFEIFRPRKIIGVLADYHQFALDKDFLPIVYKLKKNSRNYISINLNKADVKNTITTINSLWKKFFPNDPFSYFFLDDFYNKQYIADIQFNNLFVFSTIIAIIIICLGLWALSAHTISLRTKEIAIRKVLNGRTLDIFLLLSNYFYYLILVAAVISLPITYYIFKKWLQNYAFKISINWWFFVVPILLVSIITFMTIGYGIYKASMRKPADVLKYE